MTSPYNHDKLFKNIIGQKPYAIELFAKVLPKQIANYLDFENLKQEPGSFIDEENKELFTDALFSIPYNTQQAGNKKLGIYILAEHKSHPDKNIHRQLLSYLGAIYKDPQFTFPIIPLVFYHGKENWKIPLSFIETLEIPQELQKILIPYIPNFKYELFDLRDEKTNLLYFSITMQAFLNTMKDIWFLEDIKKLKKFLVNYLHPIWSEEKLVDDLLRYILSYLDENKVNFNSFFEDTQKEFQEGMEEKIMSIAEALEKKGIEKGIEQGIKAREMLAQGISLKEIIKETGLTEEQLKRLG